MQVSAIVAVTRSLVIGNSENKDNFGLPWPKSPEDMARFKALTIGHAVIMGRRTWEAIGCKPLPSRFNIVLSRNLQTWQSAKTLKPHPDGPYVFASLEAALNAFKAREDVTCWLIGGAEIFRAGLEHCSRLELTVFTKPYTGDVKLSDIGPFSNLEPIAREPFSGGWFLSYRR